MRVHDPLVSETSFRFEMEAQGFNLDDNQVKFVVTDPITACSAANAIVVLTEFDEFKSYDYSALRSQMS